MTVYRIVDWIKNFENNRTRELVSLSWVPIPNKMDGDGYTELVDHEDGSAHLGAWLAIVQIASKCNPRGTLFRDPAPPCGDVRDGLEVDRTRLRAHDFKTLARVSRLKEGIFADAIPRLIDIGWIESVDMEGIENKEVTTIPQGSAGLPQGSAPRVRAPAGGRGMELNGMEGNKESVSDVPTPVSVPKKEDSRKSIPDGFAKFWNACPAKARQRSGRAVALAEWKRQNLEQFAEPALTSLQAWKQCEAWRKDAGQFIPGIHRWLKAELYRERPASAEDALDLPCSVRGKTTDQIIEILRSEGRLFDEAQTRYDLDHPETLPVGWYDNNDVFHPGIPPESVNNEVA